MNSVDAAGGNGSTEVEARLPRAALAVVVAVAVVPFLGSLGADFTYDDRWIIVENPRVHDLGRIPDLFTTNYWGDADNGGLYRPLTLVTFAVQHALHGLAPFGYHLVNVALHAAVSLLVLLLAARRLPVASAVAAGALFAVHPVHTEAVAGVVGRAELLAACGVLSALLLASPRDGGPLGLGRTAAALAALAAALFSKEIAIVFLPLWLLLRARDAEGLGSKRALAPLAGAVPFATGAALLTVAFLVVKAAAVGSVGVPRESIPFVNNPLASAEAVTRVATALSITVRYAGLLVAPVVLSHDYSYAQIPEVSSLLDPMALAGAALWGSALAGGIVTLVSTGRSRSSEAGGSWSRRGASATVAFGAAWIGISLLPVSNLVVPIGTVMAERLLYLPSVGFVLIASSLIGLAGSRRRETAAVLAAVLVLAGGTRTWWRTSDWSDNRTLYEKGVETSPRSARTHLELGKLLYNESLRLEGASRRELEERAARVLERGFAIAPDADPVARMARGLLYERRLKLDEAAAEYRRAREIRPYATAWLAELRVLASLGRREALRLSAEELLDRKTDEGFSPSARFWEAVADTLTGAGEPELARRANIRAASAPRTAAVSSLGRS
jgi:hypothetical protein